MPTNLPPQYYDVEEKFRAASDPQEKIEFLQELIGTVPKHKGTDKLRADLRRKLSNLRDSAKSGKKAARHESPYRIDREGAGQVVICGPANTGKSSLLRAVTNAEPEVEPYPFSTWGPTPGMIAIDNVQVQLIDTPALDRDYIEPDHIDLIRRSDLALIVLDIQDFPIEQLQWTMSFLAERGIVPEGYEGTEGRGRRTLPFVVAVNKVDDESHDEDYEVFCQLLEEDWETVPISAETSRNLDALRWSLFGGLKIMRVYSKAPGREADLEEPFVLPLGSDVETFAAHVHQDFVANLKSARIWGSGEFEGQMVSRDHVLQDGDIVELKA